MFLTNILIFLLGFCYFPLESCIVDNYTTGTVALVNYNLNATELGCTLLEMVRNMHQEGELGKGLLSPWCMQALYWLGFICYKSCSGGGV